LLNQSSSTRIQIGRRAPNLSAADALDYVAGYCTNNDVSARDFFNFFIQI
jgi:2-keto-4-pentenoate hydratase/2-oxohepta-3-ene-1,7-dioic acid hydratase in catechol pathway